MNKIKTIKQNLAHELIHKERISEWSRMIGQIPKVGETLNQKELRVVGMRRSGNHAIINWIRKQQEGTVFHINDLEVYETPYRPSADLLRQYRDEVHHFNRQQWLHEMQSRRVIRDCLIYNYEDYDLESITSHLQGLKHDFYVGKSKVRFDVLILRDPLNLIASRLNPQKPYFRKVKTRHKGKDIPASETVAPILELWLTYAQEFLNETSYLRHNKICLNYNRWVTDLNYRKEIASYLKLSFTDAGISEVTSYGGGSSFEGTHFSGSASQMNTLNRWKKFEDHPAIHQILENQEVMHYVHTIFEMLELKA